MTTMNNKYYDTSSFLTEYGQTKQAFYDMVLAKITDTNPIGAFVAGSLAAGHGTRNSDLDINVLLSEKNYHALKGSVINIFWSGMRIDFTFLNIADIQSFSNLLSTVDFNSPTQDYASHEFLLKSENKDFEHNLGRTLSGEAIFKSEEITEIFRQLFEKNVFKWFAHRFRIDAENCYDDVSGFFDSEDFPSAYVSGLNMLCKCYCSFLLRNNIYIDREKWVIYHLNTSYPKEYLKFSEILNLGPSQLSTQKILNLADYLLENV